VNQANLPNHRKRVVIVGGGFGGAYCAQALEKTLRGLDVEVVLIDRNNYFLFYPLLVEAGTGALEPRHAVVSIRAFLQSTLFRMAECRGVDLERQQIRYQVVGKDDVDTLDYDHLVVSLGAVTNLPDVPGLREYGFEMKSMTDAVGMRDRAIQMLEAADATPDPAKRAAFLNFVVVGGNFSGVEVAGELDVFLRRAARLYRNLHPRECRVTLVEIQDRILPALDADLAEFARAHLQKRGVEVRLESSISEIHADSVKLDTGDSLATRTVIWCAGIAPNPLIKQLGLPTGRRGYIECERDLRVQGYDSVWAIGDCAVNRGPDGVAYPATAQHAVRQGKALASNIARAFRGEPLQPCDIVSQGSLAALGCRTGVAKVFGFRLAGFPAWFLWRTVYLMKMPLWSRRIRIALDWTIDLLFARDYVQLGVHRATTRLGTTTGRGTALDTKRQSEAPEGKPAVAAKSGSLSGSTVDSNSSSTPGKGDG